MRTGDTSALYALLHPADRHHAAAMDAMRNPDPVLVPAEVLVELEGLIRFRSGAATAAHALEDLLALPNLRVAAGHHWEATLATYRRHARLSLADAVVVAQCLLHDAQPLTFDDAIRDTVP